MIRAVAMGLLALPLAGSLLVAQGAEKPKVVWHPRYAEAQKEAQKDWRVILINAGRDG